MPDIYDILLSDLPQGIMLCLKNSDRHREDAQILAEKERYPSAIPQLFIAIEEFGKAVFLTAHIIKIKKIAHKDAEKYFTTHRLKLKLFFDYLNGIEGYEQATGKNTWIQLKEIISNEQDYKLRMLYVDYERNKIYNNSERGKTTWWDPNFIWQLMFFNGFDTNLSLKTKYDELKKDLETAITHFRFSPHYDVVCKVQPKKRPNIQDIMILLDYHFLLKDISAQRTIGVEQNKIIINLSPHKSQKNWINEDFLSSIKKELNLIYPKFNAEVKIFEK